MNMAAQAKNKQAAISKEPSTWRVCDISDLCALQRGHDITEATRELGDIPVYSSSGISYFHSVARLTPPAVITGRKGILGRVYFVEEPCWPHDTTLWVKDFKDNDPRFVYWFLLGFRLERFDAATSVPTLNRNNLIGIPIEIPGVVEQRAIATALSDVDALLAKLDALVAKKRDLKQATMQQLLTGQTRLPGFGGEWEVRRLGDVVELCKGQLITEKDAVFGEIPVIAGGKKPAYSHNQPNRVGKTITVSASGASAGYVSFFNAPIFASDCSTIGDGKTYSIEFIYFQLLLKQDAIYRAQTGGAQPHIHAVDLMPLEIGACSLDEQTAIATVLSDMDTELTALEARRDKTRALKQGMMQELLTGRTRLL